MLQLLEKVRRGQVEFDISEISARELKMLLFSHAIAAEGVKLKLRPWALYYLKQFNFSQRAVRDLIESQLTSFHIPKAMKWMLDHITYSKASTIVSNGDLIRFALATLLDSFVTQGNIKLAFDSYVELHSSLDELKRLMQEQKYRLKRLGGVLGDLRGGLKRLASKLAQLRDLVYDVLSLVQKYVGKVRNMPDDEYFELMDKLRTLQEIERELNEFIDKEVEPKLDKILDFLRSFE